MRSPLRRVLILMPLMVCSGGGPATPMSPPSAAVAVGLEALLRPDVRCLFLFEPSVEVAHEEKVPGIDLLEEVIPLSLCDRQCSKVELLRGLVLLGQFYELLIMLVQPRASTGIVLRCSETGRGVW